MTEYLSKEEIKQWRSSLEKITLEDYAKRLGKTLRGEKETNDIVDIVLSHSKTKYFSDIKDDATAEQTVKEAAKAAIDVQSGQLYTDVTVKGKTKRLNFNKPLTEREQKVLNYFVEHSDEIVIARDLAKILDLPTDYVYKYIKNLRTKIAGDILQNATKGGYKLSI